MEVECPPRNPPMCPPNQDRKTQRSQQFKDLDASWRMVPLPPPPDQRRLAPAQHRMFARRAVRDGSITAGSPGTNEPLRPESAAETTGPDSQGQSGSPLREPELFALTRSPAAPATLGHSERRLRAGIGTPVGPALLDAESLPGARLTSPTPPRRFAVQPDRP